MEEGGGGGDVGVGLRRFRVFRGFRLRVSVGFRA